MVDLNGLQGFGSTDEVAMLSPLAEKLRTFDLTKKYGSAVAVDRVNLSVRAGEVFANREKALHWLQSPNPSLEGKTPLEAARTEEGYQEADDVLTRIEHGVIG